MSADTASASPPSPARPFPDRMHLQPLLEQAQFRAWRLLHQAGLALLEDPAWLALAFC